MTKTTPRLIQSLPGESYTLDLGGYEWLCCSALRRLFHLPRYRHALWMTVSDKPQKGEGWYPFWAVDVYDLEWSSKKLGKKVGKWGEVMQPLEEWFRDHFEKDDEIGEIPKRFWVRVVTKELSEAEAKELSEASASASAAAAAAAAFAN